MSALEVPFPSSIVLCQVTVRKVSAAAELFTIATYFDLPELQICSKKNCFPSLSFSLKDTLT